jgi:biotin synthase-like enzyme
MPHGYTQSDSGSSPRPPLASPAVPATTEPLAAARRALIEDRRPLTLDELSVLSGAPDADIGELATLAHEVRLAWCGDAVEVEGILSAKTGGCPEDCQFNFLDPRPGTPLAGRPLVAAREAIRWIAVFRLALPGVILRYAGGREVTLGDLQEVGMTSGINALIVGNYLTTLGRAPQEDLVMLDNLRMPIGTLSKAI